MELRARDLPVAVGVPERKRSSTRVASRSAVPSCWEIGGASGPSSRSISDGFLGFGFGFGGGGAVRPRGLAPPPPDGPHLVLEMLVARARLLEQPRRLGRAAGR